MKSIVLLPGKYFIPLLRFVVKAYLRVAPLSLTINHQILDYAKPSCQKGTLTYIVVAPVMKKKYVALNLGELIFFFAHFFFKMDLFQGFPELSHSRDFRLTLQKKSGLKNSFASH